MTLSVAVALSYFEAITLAPARCAQMLDTSRAGAKRLGRARRPRLRRARARLRARRSRVALRCPSTVLAARGRVILGASRLVATQLKQEFVPSQDQSRLNVRLTTAVGADLDETDRARQAGRGACSRKHPEIVAHADARSSVGSARMSLTLVEPERAQADRSSSSQAALRKELQQIPGARARRCRTCRSRASAAAAASPSTSRCAAPTGTTLVALVEEAREGARDERPRRRLDSDYQLGAPELAGLARPRRAPPTSASTSATSRRTVNALVGGNIVGKYSTAGRRIDIRMRLLARSARGPRTSTLLRVRVDDRRRSCRCRWWSTQRGERRRSRRSTTPNRERAIRINGNVGAGHSQSEAMAYVARARARTLPLGYRVVLSAARARSSATR